MPSGHSFPLSLICLLASKWLIVFPLASPISAFCIFFAKQNKEWGRRTRERKISTFDICRWNTSWQVANPRSNRSYPHPFTGKPLFNTFPSVTLGPFHHGAKTTTTVLALWSRERVNDCVFIQLAWVMAHFLPRSHQNKSSSLRKKGEKKKE